MLAQSLNQLLIKKQYRAHPKPKYEVNTLGYDTETIGGKCALIACSDGRYCIPDSFDDIVNILCNKKTYGSFGFFYNIKYDFNAILKWLPETLWLEIYHKGEAEVSLLNGKVIRIYYIPQKFLKIRYYNRGKAGKAFSFFDISQYYGKMSLNKASKKYLNKEKKDSGYDLATLTIEQIRTDKTIGYCIYDAKLTKWLADHWVDICHKNDLYPSNFSSTASISARYFNERVDIPTINSFLKNDYRKKLLLYPWSAVSGAFISVFKRGYFEKVYVYDINSAYPFQMSLLPDIRKGTFKKSKRVIKDAKLGWLRAKIKISTDDIGYYHPCFPILRDRLSNYYPVGSFQSYITLLEYNELKQYFDISPMDGLYWIPEVEDYLFKNTINDIYKTRKTTDDSNINFFLKIILNSIYGKFLERHPILDMDDENFKKFQTGNFFNPFYASYILAGTRVQIFKQLLKLNSNSIIAVFTDSIITSDPLDINIDNKLGGWGYEGSGEAVVIGCGVYTIKYENAIKTKIRGFHTTSKINLFDIIKSNKSKNKLTIQIKINISPLTSIIQKRTNDMNLILDDVKEIDINFDTKRLWIGSFKNSHELLEKTVDSQPIFAGII